MFRKTITSASHSYWTSTKECYKFCCSTNEKTKNKTKGMQHKGYKFKLKRKKNNHFHSSSDGYVICSCELISWFLYSRCFLKLQVNLIPITIQVHERLWKPIIYVFTTSTMMKTWQNCTKLNSTYLSME